MTAARRLAAILAVDVAGYSRLMDEHEAGTARAVAIATSTVTIFDDRFTSTPAVRRVGAGPQVSKSTSGDTGVSDCALGSTARDISGSNPSRSATS